MTQELLLSVIMCLCGNLKPMEEAVTCAEKYVNCAIVKDGKILSKEDFAKKCSPTKECLK